MFLSFCFCVFGVYFHDHHARSLDVVHGHLADRAARHQHRRARKSNLCKRQTNVTNVTHNTNTTKTTKTTQIQITKMISLNITNQKWKLNIDNSSCFLQTSSSSSSFHLQSQPQSQLQSQSQSQSQLHLSLPAMSFSMNTSSPVEKLTISSAFVILTTPFVSVLDASIPVANTAIYNKKKKTKLSVSCLFPFFFVLYFCVSCGANVAFRTSRHHKPP
jgi:hypothetical protein